MTFIVMIKGTVAQGEVGLKAHGIQGAQRHSDIGSFCRFLVPESENDKLLRWLMRPSRVPHPPMTLMYFTPYSVQNDGEKAISQIGFGAGHRASRQGIYNRHPKLPQSGCEDGVEASSTLSASEADSPGYVNGTYSLD